MKNEIRHSVLMENISCPLGCIENDLFVLSGHDLLHGLAGKFSVVQCTTCGLMRTNPRPKIEAIGSYYPDNYGPYIATRVEKTSLSRLGAAKRIFGPLYRKVFNSRSWSFPSMTAGYLLEVGCASGSFLHAMAGSGWRVEGIEASENAAKSAIDLGYRVHVGTLENAPKPEFPIDLLVGWMVLEHLHDPIGCLKKLHGWADSDAWLVMSVPNAGSLEFKLFKDKWYDLSLPTHLYHFTPETLMNVLEKGGWMVEKTIFQRNMNSLYISVAYILEEKGWLKCGRWIRNMTKSNSVWLHLLFPIAWFLSVIKQSGRMTVWARRIN